MDSDGFILTLLGSGADSRRHWFLATLLGDASWMPRFLPAAGFRSARHHRRWSPSSLIMIGGGYGLSIFLWCWFFGGVRRALPVFFPIRDRMSIQWKRSAIQH